MNQVEKRDAIVKKLTEYESSLNLPINNAPGTEEELEEYLSMTKDVIEKQTPQRLRSICIRLSQYSFYLQRCINKNKAIKVWATHEINRMSSKEITQYDKFVKHEVKMYQIANTNVAVQELNTIINNCDQIINTLSDLSSGIRNLSYVFSLECKTKLGDRSE